MNKVFETKKKHATFSVQMALLNDLCALSLTIDIVSDKDKSKLKDAILIWLTKAKLLINKAQGETQ
jgi:hypothetical protein